LKITNGGVQFANGEWHPASGKEDFPVVYVSSSLHHHAKISFRKKTSFSDKVYLFTYYLIQSFLGKADVNNDKKVTAKEMYMYVRINVAARSNNDQIPIMFGRFSENTVIVSYK